jgi:DNA topoisomerase-1
MKYTMKSLSHNGINIPQYDYKGFSIRIKTQPIKLSQKTEQMALAWVRKEQSPLSPPDAVFYKNFFNEFLAQLKTENPALSVVDALIKHAETLNGDNIKTLSSMIDFSEIKGYLAQEQAGKLNMTKEEKKKLTAERKAKREDLKKTYGYAKVDGKEIEIANYTAEPSCLFAGRGDHPQRGRWKEGPTQADTILNLSPGSPRPPGKWKDPVWEPDKMYIAKWEDKLSGKIKYIWFSDSTFMKQMREKEKYKKAQKLDKKIPEIEAHITKNLEAENDEKRKIATVCWLIFNLNLRVGDEKDPGEADTVGAITLRPEHISIKDGILHFDFLGKDCVRWTKDVEAPSLVIQNIKHYAQTCKEYLFEGINSRKVARFFSEKLKGLTAKVFRTWRCTKTVEESLADCKAKREDFEFVKKFCARKANLEGAKVANHKRKVPAKFDERLVQREAKLKQLENELEEKTRSGKKTDAFCKRLEKSRLDLKLLKETKEYNLGTSLKSYIDPSTYVEWADKVEFDLSKFYPKTLQNKFSWALGKKPEIRTEQEPANK